MGINSGNFNNSVCVFYLFFLSLLREVSESRLTDSEVNCGCKLTGIGNFNTDFIFYVCLF